MKPPATHRARDRLLGVTQWAKPIFDAAAALRAQHQDEWPHWCYLPLPLWQLAHQALPCGLPNPDDDALVAAMGIWRMTQGIYRIDPVVCDALLDTPPNGDIPADVLLRLPQWCVYVETPPERMRWGGAGVHGFWAWLDCTRKGRANLNTLLDGPAETLPLCLPLGAGSLDDAMQFLLHLAQKRAAQGYMSQDLAALFQHYALMMQPIRDTLAQLLPLLLYICTTDSMQQRPSNPLPQKTKRGMQIFPASQPRVWDVGVRMGAALRAAYAAEGAGTSGGGIGHASPRGHVRRAHWHGFRSGPRLTADGQAIPAEKRPFELRWMPPIAVNLPDIEALPATIHAVK